MNRKSSNLIVGFIFLFLILFVNFQVKAADSYKLWNVNETSVVDKNKKWTITFNKDVNLDSVKGAIAVYRLNDNTKVDVDISINGKLVIITPKSSYENGKEYFIAIEKTIKSIDGKNINEPVQYKFRINDVQNVNTENFANSYEEYYNFVKNAIVNYNNTLTVTINNYNQDIYNLDVVDKVIRENPEVLGVVKGASASIENSNSVKMTITFNYNDTKENLQEKEIEVQNKVQEIIKHTINNNMKDWEKELALHDYLVNNSQYDKRLFSENMPQESYTAYGVLIKGTGVCQGYAEAMYRLLNAAGIETKVIIGEANDGTSWIGHAWNIVNIGGKYYQLDSTWDDPIMGDGSDFLSHSYFNITDNQISKDHKWNTNDYPKCDNSEFSFVNLNVTETASNGNIMNNVNNYNDFYNFIRTALIEKKSEVDLKIKNYDENIYNVSYTMNKIYKSGVKFSGYSYTFYKDDINNIMYMEIQFN